MRSASIYPASGWSMRSGPSWKSARSCPHGTHRPFDGTDAAVAAPGELEVELQPAGVQHEQGAKTLIAPWTVLNIGLSEG